MLKFVGKLSVVLKWWICFTLINVATVFLFLTGVVDKINEVDFTKISFLIYTIFYIFSVRTGVLAYRFSAKSSATKEDVIEYNHKNEVGWFAADSLLTLGMIGTVIGFIYMLNTSFSGISAVDTNVLTIKTALNQMSVGMSTALYTTASGLVCSLLLKIQLFDFSQYLGGVQNEFKK